MKMIRILKERDEEYQEDFETHIKISNIEAVERRHNKIFITTISGGNYVSDRSLNDILIDMEMES